MTSGEIPISSGAAYCTESEWRNKYQIAVVDESSAQFLIDVREAMFKLRRAAFYLVRERIIYIDSNKKGFLPYSFLTDGNMNGSITTDDIIVYKLDTDGRTLTEVDSSNITSIDDFNSYLQFDTDYTVTSQHYVTYYCAGKPFDELDEDLLKRACMAQLTLIILDRLKRQRQLKGVSSWSAGGVSVSRDENAWKEMYDDAKQELDSFISYVKPFIARGVRTGAGGTTNTYDPSVAWSNQYFGNFYRRRNRW